MKLLIDARSLGTKPSGIGMYIYNIIRELLRFSDYKLVLITDVSLSDEMKLLENLNVRISKYGKSVSKSYKLFPYYLFVQECIYKEKPEIFWEANNLVPIRIKNPYGKLMVTIHDIFPITVPQYYGWKYEYYFKFALNKTIKNFDMILYDSVESKNETEKKFPKAREKKNFVSYIIIPRLPGVEVTDNNSFLYIGNLEKRKGTDLLLKAYEKYRQSGGGRALRLCGRVREKKIEELIKKLNETYGTISCLGYINEAEKIREYASCHCFVFPSKAEGFGIPVIEAMNYKKPIIVTELSIFREIAGENIYYLPHANDDNVIIDNLAKAMLDESYITDTNKYTEIVEKFQAENIGEGIRRFLVKNIN